MTPRARLRCLVPALLAASAVLVLAGCGDETTPAATAATDTTATDTTAGSTEAVDDPGTAPVDEVDDVCAALPVGDLNETTSVFGGPTITAQAPQDGGCLLTTADAQYLITVTSQTVDDVVAGRETADVSAGATAVTVDGDRTWIQDCGARTCVADVLGGPDPVDLVDLITLMNPVSSALTR